MGLRYAAIMAALTINAASHVVILGILLLVFNIAALLLTEDGHWRDYFVRPLAGSMFLYVVVTELRIIAHTLR